jgi:NADH-quinone oxidoreductase subunit M
VNTVPWLTILLVVPVVGALAVAALPKRLSLPAKQLALAFTVAEAVLAVLATVAYRPSQAGFQFAQHYAWIRQFGVSYSVGADGISIVLILLAAVLVPIVVLASWHESEEGKRSVPAFFALLLALEAGMVGVFAATDVFLFYVFFEAMLIPMYFLIGSYGVPREQTQRAYAAVKFLLYSLFGGLLMLAAVIGLYVVSAHQLRHGTFDFATLRQMHIAPTTQKWLFLGFFLAFAIKAPLFPFHTWLPDAGAQSPTGGAVLLVGVLDKVGTFGLMRYCIPLFPSASKFFAPLVLALAVIGIFYGALLAIGQRDMKRLVSYTSLAHFGFIALGCFAFTSQAGTGAVLYMVNHGLSTGLLFLVVGFLVARRGSRDVEAYGGMAKVTPLLAGVFLVAGLSSLALPGLNSFVSEFLVLVGTFTRYRALAIVATCGIVLAAIYVLHLFKRTMTGPIVHEENKLVADLSVREKLVVAPVVALIIALGVYPKPLIDIIRPSVTATFAGIGQTDPVPSVSTAAATTAGGSK